MKSRAFALFLSATTVCMASPADRLEFGLSDYRGKLHQLSDYEDSKVVVLAFTGTECPLVKLYGPVLSRMSDEFAGKGVTFLGINANRQDSLTEIAAYARRSGIRFPILKDLRNKLADQIGATRTPEVAVLNERREVVYLGRIDDQYGYTFKRAEPIHTWLKDAITSTLEGRFPAQKQVPAEGCLIGRQRKTDNNSPITYTSHIAGILNRHCVNCHRPGEIAPFSLTDYEEVAGWADMIREVTRDNRMPPWHADPAHGEFANSRVLTAEEKQQIDLWVRAGVPAGDLSDLPTLKPKAEGWQLASQPDIVIDMGRTFNVQSEGTVRYKYFEVDPGFKEHKWIRAAELKPGDPEVVHHILVLVRKPGQDRRGLAGGGEFLAAYVPGLRAAPYPKGAAKFVPAGSKLIFQLHYTPIGEARKDRSRIGLYFADDDEVEKVVLTQRASTGGRLRIPPGDSNYRTTASTASRYSCELLALMPHMHLRGKSFRYELEHANTRQVVLNVPQYDFNWQTVYRLREPIQISRGTRMLCTAHFDNSTENLNNPDPARTVTWGDQTWDEMMIGYYDIAVDRSQLPAETFEQPKKPNHREPTEEELNARTFPLLKRFDADGDGKIQKTEVDNNYQFLFRRLDSNDDGELTRAELSRLPAVRKKKNEP